MINHLVLYTFSILLNGCGGQQMLKNSDDTSSKVKDRRIKAEIDVPKADADSTSNNQITMTISPNIFKLPKINKANLTIINNSKYQLNFGSHYSIDISMAKNGIKLNSKMSLLLMKPMEFFQVKLQLWIFFYNLYLMITSQVNTESQKYW
ncbi:MAG TPA: hypothetical protein VF677_06725 [Flavobacterium sp.]|jgi:hypothetical protein